VMYVPKILAVSQGASVVALGLASIAVAIQFGLAILTHFVLWRRWMLRA
jgi:hypothetical protein